MRHYLVQKNLSLSLFIIVLLLIGCSPPSLEPESSEVAEEPELATARATALLTANATSATVTGHKDLQFTVDASGEGSGILVEDTLLAAQATCGVFVAEKAAQELDIPLMGSTATSIFDTEQRRVNVYLDLPGADDDQVLSLANNFRQRCPIYTTLAEAESVDFTPGEQFEGAAEGETVVTATLFRFGGANVTANNQTFVMDSVPPLDGPNNELNPLDMMLGGLAACTSFVVQEAVPNEDVFVVIEGDFDPTGVRVLEGPNPRIQRMRIIFEAEGVDEAMLTALKGQIEERCDLFAILEGSVSIDLLVE